MNSYIGSRRGLTLGLVLAAVLVATGAGLGAGSSGASTPVIARLSPTTLAPAMDPQTLTFAGQDFQAHLTLTVTTPDGASVQYCDEVVQLPRESSFQVPVMLATAGKYTFVVQNPDGGKSNPFTADVKAETKPPLPVIQYVSPDEITRGQEPQTLTVTGKNFGPGLRAIVTDPQGVDVVEIVVRDVTPASFKLSLKLESSGPYNLVVSNATGAVSNIVTITVK